MAEIPVPKTRSQLAADREKTARLRRETEEMEKQLLAIRTQLPAQRPSRQAPRPQLQKSGSTQSLSAQGTGGIEISGVGGKLIRKSSAKPPTKPSQPTHVVREQTLAVKGR